MRDFPFFTTEYGVSSLVLKEIPYKKEAYICIRDVPREGFADHLCECVSFCKMAGADRVFASGSDLLEEFPLADTICEMSCSLDDAPDPAHLFPVTQATVGQWRDIYNRRMSRVFNSRTLESRDEKQILESEGAYFVHDNGTLLGIGWMDGDRLLAVASVQPGAGARVVRTLMTLAQEQMILEVASSNQRAVALYQRLGFSFTRPISRWFDVTGIRASGEF